MDHLTSDSPEVIWAAGFLEGEGYFSIDKRDGRQRLGAAQVNHEPLHRLAQTFEVGRIYYRNQNPGVRRSWWGWEVAARPQTNLPILQITALIMPWLTENRLSRIPWLSEAEELRTMKVVT